MTPMEMMTLHSGHLLLILSKSRTHSKATRWNPTTGQGENPKDRRL